jgi:hypothetical protein
VHAAPTVSGSAFPWFSNKSSHGSSADQPGGTVLSLLFRHGCVTVRLSGVADGMIRLRSQRPGAAHALEIIPESGCPAGGVPQVTARPLVRSTALC